MDEEYVNAIVAQHQSWPLTKQQLLWIYYYVGEANCNAHEAALMAGYEPSTAKQAQRWTQKPALRAVIDDFMYQKGMGAAEIVMRMSQHARANLKDLADADGNLPSNLAGISAEKAAVIKEMSIRTNRDGSKNVTVKLHDSQAALKELAKRFELFPDSINHHIPTSELDAAISEGLALMAGREETGVRSGVGEEDGGGVIEADWSPVGGGPAADVSGVRPEDPAV
jgi:hypothetical protein